MSLRSRAPAIALNLLVVLALQLVGAGCRFGGAPASDVLALPATQVVRQGRFEVTIEEVGVVRARTATSVKAPFWGRVQKVVAEGTRVEQGEPVLWMDATDLERRLERQEADLSAARSQLDSRLEELALRRRQSELETRASESRLRFGASRLASQSARTEDTRRQVDLALVAHSALEREEAAQREAEMEDLSARLRHAIQLEGVSLQERQLEADRTQAERRYANSLERRDDTRRDLDAAVVRAPAAGQVFLPVGWFEGAEEQRKVREGDAVGPWSQPVLELPDTSTLEVRTQVGEADLERVREGTPARIRPTALTGLSLPGRVTRVALLAVPRSKSEGAGFSEVASGRQEQVVVQLVVSLDGVDPRLQPGMSVSVAFVLDTLADVVSVPESAVLGSAEDAVVFVRSARGRPEHRSVRLGPASGGRVVVLEGLAAEETLFLGDPREPARRTGAGS